MVGIETKSEAETQNLLLFDIVVLEECCCMLWFELI
jgi:hypothetical protein